MICPTPLSQKASGQDRKRRKLLVIAGPTATGKTELSIRIAKGVGGEILSCDSLQVYRKADIGSAKPSKEQLLTVPHHLIDIRDLQEPMNVAAYYEEATASLEEIFLRNRIPIAVGGSGFYMHTFIYGPPKGPPADQELRRKLEDDLEKFGLELLYQKLVALDPDYAASITMQDRHKVIRALEIILLTGKKVTEIPKTSEEDISSAFDFRCWFIYYPREILYKRIDDRCDAMIAAGLIEEVRSLRDALACNTAAANAIGYRQALTFLDSAQTQSDWNLFVQTFKQASRNYAKRQFTWFRKEPLFRWLDLSEMSMDHAAEILIHDLDRK